ncbi:MAG: phenylalanine--tRNA ligase subunit beta [Acidaminococcaceae bacterium]|nr:phenylalanine--tRNA ligase subunit beta [Acidaminococcaceae bacterium]
MLASIAWLKRYVDIDVTPEELAEKLTRVGLEVESVIHQGQGISGVVTGKVTAIEKNPKSDHLWVCQMDYGSGEIVQIQTGAQNVKQGDIVPVATLGAELPNGMKLKKIKMADVYSYGMLCSAAELGIDNKLLLPEQREGILILSPDTPIGKDIKEVLGLNDTVLDIDLTANKQDCFCMTGIAREVAAVLGKTLRMPDTSVKEEAGGDIHDMLRVAIEIPELCSRFTSRALKNIKIMPSPDWMQNELRACGVRPISNVVDVTNYVMMELGQPMHAYDYDTLAGHALIVRRGKAGEHLQTLDDQDRPLTPDMITIADTEKAVGLGGVMGGLITEVTDKTTTVILEAAAFNGPSIRRTSKALGLRSEASMRFERGVDIANCHRALNRAAHLLEEMGACETVCGIADAYPVPYKPAVITVTPETINTRIGVEIPKEEMADILHRLQFAVKEENGALVITAPTWRQDVTCDADISEEIARMHSYDKIESHNPELALRQGKEDPMEEVKGEAEDYLASAGLDEVMTYTFIHPSFVDKMMLKAEDARRSVIRLMNPISDEFGVMRTTMLPSLLNTAAYNLARQAESVKIFEVGRVYLPKSLPLTDHPEERRMIGAVMSGRRNELTWTSGKDSVDFYDMKGVVEGLLEKMQLADYELAACEETYMHPGKSCVIKAGGRQIGYFGCLHPTVAASFDVPEETYVLELELAPLAESALRVPQYTHLAKFPGTSRDIAVVVPKNVTMQELESVLRTNAGELLKGIRVFDVYTGKQVAEGCKSVAFNLTFQAEDRTLTDGEIDPIIKNVVEKVAEAYAAELRK